jgi:hypothetical protein
MGGAQRTQAACSKRHRTSKPSPAPGPRCRHQHAAESVRVAAAAPHLHRSDGALLGGGDALLQLAQVRGQGGLVAHRGGDAAQQGRHLRVGLREEGGGGGGAGGGLGSRKAKTKTAPGAGPGGPARPPPPPPPGPGWEDGRQKDKRRAELGGAEGLVSLLISNVKEQKTSKTTKPKLIKNAVPAAAAAVGGAPG